MGEREKSGLTEVDDKSPSRSGCKVCACCCGLFGGRTVVRDPRDGGKMLSAELLAELSVEENKDGVRLSTGAVGPSKEITLSASCSSAPLVIDFDDISDDADV